MRIAAWLVEQLAMLFTYLAVGGGLGVLATHFISTWVVYQEYGFFWGAWAFLLPVWSTIYAVVLTVGRSEYWMVWYLAVCAACGIGGLVMSMLCALLQEVFGEYKDYPRRYRF